MRHETDIPSHWHIIVKHLLNLHPWLRSFSQSNKTQFQRNVSCKNTYNIQSFCCFFVHWKLRNLSLTMKYAPIQCTKCYKFDWISRWYYNYHHLEKFGCSIPSFLDIWQVHFPKNDFHLWILLLSIQTKNHQ